MENRFGTWLDRQLIRRELSKSDFARAINRTPARVSEWVLGRRVPDPASCEVIADALRMDLDLVLWQAGHRPNVEAIDLDSPKAMVHGWVDRIDWAEPGRIELAERVFTGWIADDRKRNQ